MLRFFGCLVTAAICVAGPGRADDQCLLPQNGQEEMRALFDQINALRIGQGLNPLVPAPSLMISAQMQACTLAAGQSAQTDAGFRMKAAGCKARATLEVSARGTASGTEVMSLWQRNTANRRAMTLPGLTEIGLGIAAPESGETGGVAWVMAVSSGC